MIKLCSFYYIECSLFQQCLTREWFGIVVSHHVISRAPLDNQLFGINIVFDEEVLDVDVFGGAGGAEDTILL